MGRMMRRRGLFRRLGQFSSAAAARFWEKSKAESVGASISGGGISVLRRRIAFVRVE